MMTGFLLDWQSHLDLEQQIKDLIEKENDLIAKRRDRTMKYALENLPELIGETDFRDLCAALVGVDMGTGEEARRRTPTGQEFAEMVRSMVIRQQVQTQIRLAKTSERGLPL